MPAQVERKNTRGNEVHVGNAMFKSNGHKAHDGKEHGKYLGDGLAGRQRHPNRQTDHPVTAHRPDKGFTPGEVNLGQGNAHSCLPKLSAAGLPQTGTVEQKRQQNGAQEIGPINDSPTGPPSFSG